MRRGSLFGKLTAALLLVAFTMAQALAAVHVCSVGMQPHEAECIEYVAVTDGGTPDAKAGWHQVLVLPKAVASWFVPVVASPDDAAALHLARLVPEVRNISIALLNLRQ